MVDIQSAVKKLRAGKSGDDRAVTSNLFIHGTDSWPPGLEARFTVFLCKPAMRTRWMAGAAVHTSG